MIHSKNLLIFILMVGVFGILNTEMGFIGILPYIAERYDVTIVHAGLLISLFALGVFDDFRARIIHDMQYDLDFRAGF